MHQEGLVRTRYPVLYLPSARVTVFSLPQQAGTGAGKNHSRAATSRPTKLEAFLESRGLKPLHVARACGYSRQHLLRLRLGRMDPTRGCMVAVTAACRRLSRERVSAWDLFDLEPHDSIEHSTKRRGGRRP